MQLYILGAERVREVQLPTSAPLSIRSAPDSQGQGSETYSTVGLKGTVEPEGVIKSLTVRNLISGCPGGSCGNAVVYTWRRAGSRSSAADERPALDPLRSRLTGTGKRNIFDGRAGGDR